MVFLRSITAALNALADLLYPRVCAGCGEAVAASTGYICADCLRNMPRIAEPSCRRCGLSLGPYALDHDGRWCAGCENLPLSGFRRTAAFGAYEDGLRRMIGAFKYRRRPQLMRDLGACLAGRSLAVFGDELPDVVLPVPLHEKRLRARGFDQALLLAGEVARAMDRPLATGALARVIDTPTLNKKSRQERAETVKGAFRVERPEAVAGRRVLLVDDVMTTGATCSECARVLKSAGAAEVMVAVLARTP